MTLQFDLSNIYIYFLRIPDRYYRVVSISVRGLQSKNPSEAVEHMNLKLSQQSEPKRIGPNSTR